jgi:hypothetical protein
VEKISSSKTGKVLLSDSFKETVKSFFFDISANLPAQCTRADWCLHASNTPGSCEIIEHVLICRYGSRNEAWGGVRTRLRNHVCSVYTSRDHALRIFTLVFRRGTTLM